MQAQQRKRREQQAAGLTDLSPVGSQLPVRLVMSLAVQIANGLQELHSQGMVHGDLRPSNVLVGNKQPQQQHTASPQQHPSPPITRLVLQRSPKASPVTSPDHSRANSMALQEPTSGNACMPSKASDVHMGSGHGVGSGQGGQHLVSAVTHHLTSVEPFERVSALESSVVVSSAYGSRAETPPSTNQPRAHAQYMRCQTAPLHHTEPQHSTTAGTEHADSTHPAPRPSMSADELDTHTGCHAQQVSVHMPSRSPAPEPSSPAAHCLAPASAHGGDTAVHGTHVDSVVLPGPLVSSEQHVHTSEPGEGLCGHSPPDSECSVSLSRTTTDQALGASASGKPAAMQPSLLNIKLTGGYLCIVSLAGMTRTLCALVCGKGYVHFICCHVPCVVMCALRRLRFVSVDICHGADHWPTRLGCPALHGT